MVDNEFGNLVVTSYLHGDHYSCKIDVQQADDHILIHTSLLDELRKQIDNRPSRDCRYAMTLGIGTHVVCSCGGCYAGSILRIRDRQGPLFRYVIGHYNIKHEAWEGHSWPLD
jgi:hypothetical protein